MSSTQRKDRKASDWLGNRYRLLDLLGAGGMGSVYRAFDQLTGETVALKRVAGSTLQPTTTPEQRLALAREFRALAGLRHPNIIAVRDYGFATDRQPYFTMELLPQARSLVDASQWLDGPGKLDLLLQLLAALVYIHRREIIHRDLKPGNVLLVGHEVKVLDFGLATLSGQVLPSSGTLAYMAPEVLRGEMAGMAADLYAVGVMAYELFAGWHPFAHAGDIAQAILQETPDFTFVEIAPPLQAVVQRLLAKQPVERYADATAVIQALCAAGQRPLPLETAATRESFLQAAPFIGREPELAQLTTALQQALQRAGSSWLVGGESGIGKSRLLQELRTHALVAGAVVLRGQAVGAGGAAYQLWREVFRLLVLFAQPDDLEAAVLQPLVPDIANLLERVIPAAPVLEAKAAQTRLLLTLIDLIRRCTLRQPLVLVLEDLHWADDNSLALLQRLNQLAAHLPLLIVGSYREDEQPQLPQQLPEMQLLHITRLGPASIAQLSEAMLGVGGRQPQLVHFLQQETEGNTFFLVEVMRALAEEAGRLDRIREMVLPKHVFAGGIQQLVQRRLQRVPPVYHPLLQLAAVAGRQLDLALLRQLDGTTDLAAWLDVCANAAVLAVPDDGLHWQFSHDKLREGLLSGLAEAQRQCLHQQIGVALEQVYAAELAPHYGELAYHYGQAAERTTERHYLTLAAETAQATFANSAALDYYERLLALLSADDAARASAYLKLGAVLQHVGRWAEAEARYQQALAQLAGRANELTARCYQALGILQNSRGDFAGALHWLYQAHEQFRHLNEPSYLSQNLLEIANVHYFQGNYQDSFRDLQEGLQLAQAAQADPIVALALHRLGGVYYAQGNYPEARAYGEQALALYQALGSKAGIANAFNNLGNIARITGDYPTAQHYRAESLRLRRDIGDKWGIAASLNNLAVIPYLQGDYATAQRYWSESLALRRELGDQLTIAQTLDNLGLVAFSQGDFTLARQRHAESLALRQAIGDKPGMATSLSNLAHAELDDGDLPAALDHYRASLVLSLALDDKRGIISCLVGLAGIMAQRPADLPASPGLTVQLLASAHELTEQIGAKLERDEQKLFDRSEGRVRALLGEATFLQIWQASSLTQTLIRLNELPSVGPG